MLSVTMDMHALTHTYTRTRAHTHTHTHTQTHTHTHTHTHRIPNMIKNFVGLTSRTCSPEGAQTLVQDEKEMNLLKNQLAGWKVGVRQ